LTFLAPLRLGDRVRRRSEIAEIVEKTGRIGSLFFVVVQHKWENQLGPVIEESQTLVYREAALANAERQPAPRQSDSPSAASIQCVDIDTIRLFRYSALTFNSHRIHYDAPYAVELEQYSGLVIHGPLQATLLLNHAAGVGGRALRRFSFRGARPATGAQILSLEGVLGEVDSMALTVRNAHGLVTLTAEARWR
jgi:3-methylfumaryl-CoA hydratase